jgi:hypothetical protein
LIFEAIAVVFMKTNVLYLYQATRRHIPENVDVQSYKIFWNCRVSF